MQRLTRITFNILLAAMLSGAVAIDAVADAPIKKHDQALMIKTDGQCAVSVDLVSSEDNCAGSAFAGNCGKNGKDCVCIRDKKFITWQIDNGARFELQFDGTSPFKGENPLKSGNNSKLKRKVDAPEGDYIYNVVVEGCPGQVYDPRIVLRGG